MTKYRKRATLKCHKNSRSLNYYKISQELRWRINYFKITFDLEMLIWTRNSSTYSSLAIQKLIFSIIRCLDFSYSLSPHTNRFINYSFHSLMMLQNTSVFPSFFSNVTSLPFTGFSHKIKVILLHRTFKWKWLSITYRRRWIYFWFTWYRNRFNFTIY